MNVTFLLTSLARTVAIEHVIAGFRGMTRALTTMKAANRLGKAPAAGGEEAKLKF